MNRTLHFFPESGDLGLRHQRGVALVTGMILLVVMTLLGLTAMRSGTQNTRMAVNYQHKQESFQASENGLTKMMNAPPGDVAPAALVPGTTRQHLGYFASKDPTGHRPDLFADLSVEYLETRTNLLVSGFHLNSTGYVFQADSRGCVRTATATTADDNCQSGSGSDRPTSQTTNRMGIALIR